MRCSATTRKKLHKTPSRNRPICRGSARPVVPKAVHDDPNSWAVVSHCMARREHWPRRPQLIRGGAVSVSGGVRPVVSGHTAPDGIDTAIRMAQQQLPGARAQHGFSGFLLLADRTAGKLLTSPSGSPTTTCRLWSRPPHRFGARQQGTSKSPRPEWKSAKSPCRPDPSARFIANPYRLSSKVRTNIRSCR
jgi:hypothetical protein